MTTERTTVTLRALEGTPLAHDSIREMVVATALAIAERQGIGIDPPDAGVDRITVTLHAGQLEAMGFAAELRRLTTSWYAHKFGVETLWGDQRTARPFE